jgi:hypothetical protein
MDKKKVAAVVVVILALVLLVNEGKRRNEQVDPNTGATNPWRDFA